jgi:WhiB family redox-sensing transcriptional regulator
MNTEKWRKQAACAGAPIETFIFHDDVKYSKTTKLKALEYCNSCPVKQDCLRFAYNNNIQHGVYGGLTPKERRKFRFQFRVMDQENNS